MVNTYAIVTARNASTRLPDKMIKTICGKKSVEITIERAKLTGFPVILATSTDHSDDIFEHISKTADIEIYRGALLNKLKRWKGCFHSFSIDNALLIDGDDLLYDYDIGKRAIQQLESCDADMIVHPENIICGFFTYAMSQKAFEKLAPYTEDEQLDTDVIVAFLKKSQLIMKPINLYDWEQNRNFRLTLDYMEDLMMFDSLISQTGYKASGQKIVHFLENHPEIVQMNSHRQADFLNNQQRFNQKLFIHN